MTIRVAINGFGRIGRMVYRRALQTPGVHVAIINGTAGPKELAHLLQYDSIHGRFTMPIDFRDDGWVIDGRFTKLISTRSLNQLPWHEHDIDVVIEATGKFRSREAAGVHCEQGAKKVIITAPAKTEEDADITLVRGVNDASYDPVQHNIISGASCTTNCLAPVVKVLHEEFGLRSGMVTTVHAYTNDQRNLDNPQSDLRRARACGQSIIPTSTGAAKAIGLVIPELKGRLNGLSVRIPTPNVSVVDLVAQMETKLSVHRVNEVLKHASFTREMAGVLGYTEEPLVSVDFNGDSRSAVVDGLSTMVVDETTVKVLAWYDNEWGYSCRIVDLALLVAGTVSSGNPSMAH